MAPDTKSPEAARPPEAAAEQAKKAEALQTPGTKGLKEAMAAVADATKALAKSPEKSKDGLDKALQAVNDAFDKLKAEAGKLTDETREALATLTVIDINAGAGAETAWQKIGEYLRAAGNPDPQKEAAAIALALEQAQMEMNDEEARNAAAGIVAKGMETRPA